jgi:hypothetical protein
MSNEPQVTTSTETHLPVICPHCKKGFWAKFGHVLKEVGIAAVEVPIDIALGPNFGGR